MQEVKDKILDLDIVEIISKYIDLKRAGANYKGNCPFHGEKTPSLMVSPGKNIWKCFGCGKGGNVIDFVMDHESLSFMDAMKKIASEHNIEFPKKEVSDEYREQEKHRESLIAANKIAGLYFMQNLYKSENALALEYVRSRWSPESLQLWNIGYAEDSWSGLLDHAETAGLKREILLEAGLIKESKNKPGQLFDFFRNRIIFPILDKYGRPVAFTGRDFSGSDDTPKYFNTPETNLYVKGNILYGWYMAQKEMREKEFCYLVEGNPDVIRLHEIGIFNSIGTCGTALTPEQAKLIKSLCRSVNIIGDSDKAGKMAVERSAKLLIESGIQVNIISLPDDSKEDPDSFFSSEDQFKEYVKANIKDWILLKAEEWKKKAHNPDFKAKAIDEICHLITSFDDPSVHELYIEKVVKIITPKKAWTDKIRTLLKEKEPVVKESKIPEHVTLSDFEKYGFYVDGGEYFFNSKSGIIPGSNFTMTPLFHIQSSYNAKRLYEIKNKYGNTQVVEFLQSDLVALSKFKCKVEGLGNFLWKASENELNKLKLYLYEKTETCTEVTQLGWQKEGFFAWSNGIFNGQFSKINSYGIVKHEDNNYYMPALSAINQFDDGLFMSERRFIHREDSSISLNDYAKMIIEVFGDNATIALCFYLATLFRDHIVRIINFFPILNLFGPKGAGKTELAVSILQFFGRQSKGPNINNTSKAALADHISQVANALVHIDEYKNTIEYEKIEFLKGIWDGTGRTRMNMDKDKKKETTAVDCGVILSGQEMPTADIALFSRLVYLSFYKVEYSEEEKKNFNELKEIEKHGLTHITHEILSHRKHFIDHYRDHMDIVSEELNKALKGEIIETRLFNNWMIIIAAYSVLEEKLTLPFTRNKLIKQAATQLRVQNRETKKSNEISTFWSLVQYLYADGLIQEDVDFKIDYMITTLKTDMVDVVWNEAKSVIYIQYSRIIPLYRKHGKMQGEKILPSDSIDYYLRNDKRFLGKKTVAFKAVDPKTGIEMTDEQSRKKRKITHAYAFLYDDLEITLRTESEEDNDGLFNEPNNTSDENDNNDLPF